MDKVPDLGLPFFYRVALPGVAVTVAGWPIFRRLLGVLPTPHVDDIVAFIALAIFLGFLLSMLDDVLYETFEGRRLWPNWLESRATSVWRWRVGRLVDRAKKRLQEVQGDRNDLRWREYWSKLRQFPVDAHGKPTATRPTKM